MAAAKSALLPKRVWLKIWLKKFNYIAGYDTTDAMMRQVPKKKNTAHAVQAKDFVGVKQRQNESGVLRGGKSFYAEQTLTVSHFIADSVGFVTESIMVCKMRQDDFAKFIVIKR